MVTYNYLFIIFPLICAPFTLQVCVDVLAAVLSFAALTNGVPLRAFSGRRTS